MWAGQGREVDREEDAPRRAGQGDGLGGNEQHLSSASLPLPCHQHHCRQHLTPLPTALVTNITALSLPPMSLPCRYLFAAFPLCFHYAFPYSRKIRTSTRE